jgi:hypothetical protein
MGKAPAGYMWKNPDDPTAGLSPIPGGPAEIKNKDAEEADFMQKETTKSALNRAIAMVDSAASKINPYSTGVTGQIIGKVGLAGTDRKALEAEVFTLKSMLTLDNLMAFKQASANGGSGFGSLSNIEGEKLASNVASLDVNLSEPELRENLLRVRQHYQNMLDLSNGIMPEEYSSAEGTAVTGETEQDYPEGTEIELEDGRKQILRNGEWVDL